ncbi:Protein-disulfide isomerase, putative [Shewanella piezotolerans WP3]|uniref:Protein-disulfide isomerase, putative n=1 Tax=Shewanella piezotolerans (strain WP3 / JCM 13877) TaxID=225849 RepID=B8CP49_SHEPW|nr:protein disulfide-isomerase [Shewanella piezotolerans]ACJ29293.1 Protein-disulfide isomerase, putative [Shewanella piezotolerans WP3]
MNTDTNINKAQLALYFIYDSHCPWSYAATPLVNALSEAFPKMQLHLLHCSHFDGSDSAGLDQVNAVRDLAEVKFGREHIRYANSPKDATKVANLMAWLETKQPDKMLSVLNAIQKAHFIDGNPLTNKHDFSELISTHKLSPSNKIFRDGLINDAEQILAGIAEIYEVLGTTSFPALLITVDDQGIFIDHSKYLAKPESVVESVLQEMQNLD